MIIFLFQFRLFMFKNKKSQFTVKFHPVGLFIILRLKTLMHLALLMTSSL